MKDAPRRGEDIANILRLYPLYPDQLVYLNMNLSKGKIRLDRQTGTIYVTTYQDARNIEETLVGYLYVIHTIQNRAMTIHTMKQKDVDFILNWESEKYRQYLDV